MDSLTCRSPARCAACVHFDARTGCALENELEIVLASLEAPKVAAPRPAPVLVLVDARRALT